MRHSKSVKKQQDLLKSNFKAEATDVDSIQTRHKSDKGKGRQQKCRLEQMIKAVIRHSQVTRHDACGVVERQHKAKISAQLEK